MKIRKIGTVLIVFLLFFSCLPVKIKAVPPTIIVYDENDLDTYIAAATEETILSLANDITLTKALVIPSGKEIILTSGHTGSTAYCLIGADGDFVINVLGKLSIDGITVCHLPGTSGGGVNIGSGTATSPIGLNGTCYLLTGLITGNSRNSGAGVHNNTGTFIMTGGTISGNTASYDGGGVANQSHAIFRMSGGEITNNSADLGGGISAVGPVEISGGTISLNTATYRGGGIDNMYAFGTLVMSGGTITHNTAGNMGGGVMVDGSTFTMTGGTISENQATYGGGVYVKNIEAWYGIEPGILSISGAVSIIGNKALSTLLGNGGGGIYIANYDYTKLTIGAATIFTNNTAGTLSQPAINIASLYPNIQAASTSSYSHPLNNYDINYKEVLIAVTYNPNGGTGGKSFSGVARNIQAATAAEAGVSKKNCTLESWNTMPDGSGTRIEIGDSLLLLDPLTLYAQWQFNGASPDTGDSANLYVTALLLLSLGGVLLSAKRKHRSLS